MDQNFSSVHGRDLRHHWGKFIELGDTVAFKTIYLHYYHYLTYVALKKGISTNKTKDTLNELFLYIWENQKKLIDVRDHHNYLVTAFLRRVYKKKQSALNDYVPVEEVSHLFTTASVETIHIAERSQQDISQIMDRFIAKLPQKQRNIIYQKFYLGLCYQEIAVANGISINTAYNTIYNAIDKLRALLEKEQIQALTITFLVISAVFYFFFF